jgi:1,2-diacylglycerol 3-alpha-glucosyltransferase
LNLNFNHIVFLTPGFAHNEQDCTTIPAIQIYIKALKHSIPELKITIIAFQFPFTTKKYSWHNCDVIPLGGQNKKRKKIQVWKSAYELLKKINTKNKISIIHSFWFGECTLIGYLFSTKYKIKHICTFMGQDVYSSNFYFKIVPIKKMKLVCVSDFQKQFINNGNYKIYVIPWGTFTPFFKKNRSKTFDIVGVGSLIPVKNYNLFIDIVHEISKETPLKVLLIGSGVQKKQLEEKINKLQLTKIITLTGSLPYNETIEKIAAAKLLLHTSYFESFGMIFAEAIEAQTKIVSFKVGISKPSDNWEVCDSKINMIKACKKTLDNYQFIKTNLESYAIKNTVSKYINLYNEEIF